jgi:hypothetical protein
MPYVFRILHISDLHARVDRRWSTDALLGEAKSTLLAEASQHNPDVLAFTGDITHSGKKEEYEIAAQWIEDFCLSSSGLNLDQNRILFVPGNHDVNRSLITPIATAIETSLASASNQEDAAKYLADPESIARLLERHKAYDAFCQRVRGGSALTLPSWTQTIDTPTGTFVFEGYCSSWLSSTTPDDRRLLIGQPQLTDRANVRPEHDVLIAMVHHPIPWMMEFDRTNFDGHLRTHHSLLLRGHLHRANAYFTQSSAGSYLESAAGALYDRFNRPNSFSIIDIEDDFRNVGVKLFIWSNNRWVLDRNEFSESADGVGRFVLPSRASQKKLAESISRIPAFTVQQPPAAEPRAEVLAEQPQADATSRAALSSFPRFSREARPQDLAVRLQYQETAIVAAESRRLVEIQSEWGADSYGFVATFVERWKEQHVELLVLHARCGGLTTGEQLQGVLELAASMTLPELAANIRMAGPVLIFLDDVGASVDVASVDSASLRETLNAFLDLCPNLIFVSTLPASVTTDAGSNSLVVRLPPLDAADTRHYMVAHSINSVQLQSIVDYDRVHRATGGLPAHIDKIVQSLRFTDLSGALSELNESDTTDTAQLPTSIVDEIDALTAAEDEPSVRATLLLYVLSILERGELLSVVKRLIPAEPIWPANAKRLQDCGLLDVIDTTPHRYNRFMVPTSGEKVLRIPRVVRDHVLSQIPLERQLELVTAAATLYFGSDWRNGSVRMRRRPDISPTVTAYRFSNEMLILRYLCFS